MNNQQAQQLLSVLGTTAGATAISKLVVDQLAEMATPNEAPDPTKGVAVAFAQGTSRRATKSQGRSSKKNYAMPTNVADLSVRPPKNAIPTKVPRLIANSLFWDIVTVRQSAAYGTGLNELNYAFSLNSHPKAATLAGLFDQWCIPQASVTWWNTQAPGSTATFPELHTALDFDNISAISTLQAIDGYDTSMITVLVPNKKYTRSVRPCNAFAVSGGNSVIRSWSDCATTGNTWNGIRSIMSLTGAIAAGTIIVEYSVWYAFRGRR